MVMWFYSEKMLLNLKKKWFKKIVYLCLCLWLIFCVIFLLQLNEKLKKRDSGFSINPSERPPVTISSI